MSTTLLVSHTFQSTKATSSDPTLVSASQWNLSSAHTIAGTLESSNIGGTLTSSQIVSIGSSQLNTTLPASQGGTGLTAYTIGDIIYASSAELLTSLSDAATGNALITGGVGAAPSYGKIGLATHVSGTLASSQIVSIGSSQLTGTLTSSQIVSIGSSQLTGTILSSQITSIGSSQITGALASSQIASIGSSQINTTLPASQGGTGLTSYTVGDLIVASSAELLTSLSDVATGNALITGGVGAAPSYGKIGLGSHVSGSLGSTQLGNPFTVGFSLTPYTTGTISAGTWTPNPINSNYQYYTNGGAHTLAASTVDSAIDILMYNSSSAGSVTFSGFTVSSNTGDALTTTSSNRFLVSLRRINAISMYSITALQ